MFGNSVCSRWIAPLIGAVVGSLCAVRAMARPGGMAISWVVLLIGAGIGFLGGCLVMLADRPPHEVTVWEERELGLPAGTQIPRAGSNIGRAVFMLLLLLLWIPLIGAALGVVSLILNRNWTGRARLGNRLLVGRALLLAALLITVVVIGPV